MLVQKIKFNYNNKKEYDWYFEELLKLYEPLINSASKKVYKKFKTKARYSDIKSRVCYLFFEAIKRYDPKFTEGKPKKNFNYVYFSTYLKNFLRWELMRIVKPVKIDYDDLVADNRNMEFESSLKSTKEISKKLVSRDNFNPISENFISLCRYAQKQLRNDLIADVMMLHFGYDYKNFEVARILNVPEHKIGIAMLQLKEFWADNKELLIS